jgi:hypothetical protein
MLPRPGLAPGEKSRSIRRHGDLALGAGRNSFESYFSLRCEVFKPVNRRLSVLAALFHFVALALGLIQFLPRGVNIGLGFYGFYWFDRAGRPHREVSFRRRRRSLSFMISLKSTTGRISIGPRPCLKPGSCETS